MNQLFSKNWIKIDYLHKRYSCPFEANAFIANTLCTHTLRDGLGDSCRERQSHAHRTFFWKISNSLLGLSPCMRTSFPGSWSVMASLFCLSICVNGLQASPQRLAFQTLRGKEVSCTRNRKWVWIGQFHHVAARVTH